VDASLTFRLLGISGAENKAEDKVEDKAETPSASVLASLTEASISDEELMAQIVEGSREALAVLFRRYAGLVRGVACRVLRDAFEADDLLQEVFILIHRLSKSFDPSRGSARFWILQTTHQRAISRRRYLNSRHHFYRRVDPNQTAEQQFRNQKRTGFGHPRSIEEALHQKETLQTWFEQLSPDQRETLRLFFFEGYTFEEIAAKLGQTTVNARNHYYRGLERLRKRLFAGQLPGVGAL
jgi:RNA polymerase sigma-70 factor, ECF subfamily